MVGGLSSIAPNFVGGGVMRKESSNTLTLKTQSKSKCRAFLLVALATIFAVFGIYLVTGCGKSAKRFSVRLPVLEVEGLYKIKPLSPTQKLSSGSKFKFSITFDKDIDPESVRVQANLDVLTPISKTSPNPPAPEETDGNAVKETVAGGAEEDEQGTTAEWGDTYTYSTTIISDTFIVLGELPYYTHDLQVTETPPHITISYCGMGGWYDESIAVQLYPVESWQGTYPGLGVGFDVATGYVLYVTVDLSGYTDTTIHTTGLSQLAHTEKNNFHKFTFVVVGKTDDPVSITWEGTPKEYTLGEIPEQVTVKSESQELHAGDTVLYDQELTIEPVSEDVGEDVEQIIEVTGAKKLSKANTYTVTGDVSITYKLGDKPTLDKLRFDYVSSKSGGYYLVSYNARSSGGKVVVPGKYNDGEHGELPVMIQTTESNRAFQDGAYYITDVVLNEGITSIGWGSFRNLQMLVTLKLPSTLTRIEDEAFTGCSFIEIINNSPLKLTLGSANYGHVAENACVIVTDESKRGDFDKVYDGMKYYENTYQNKLVALGFEDPETAPSTLTFKEGTVGTGYLAFYDCDNITNIVFPDGNFAVGNGAFSSCDGLQEISIPAGVNLGYGAFNFSGLKRVTLPEGMVTINTNLFGGCVKLTEINIPSTVKTIGDDAFSGCSALENIKLPSSLTRIGDQAFSNCDKVTDLKIPENVTYIGSNAFRFCDSLTSVTLPSKITEVEPCTFQYCPNLQSINLGGATKIGDEAFAYCSSLVNVTFSKNLTSIGDGAFRECTSLLSVTLPQGLTSLGYHAFYGCTNLRSVTLTRAFPVTFNSTPFEECPRLIEVINKTEWDP